jgi:hypothetical protein
MDHILLQYLPGRITEASLDGVAVLIIGTAWGPFDTDEIKAVESYVTRGGGLLLAGVGWSWAGAMADYPMTRMAKPYGVGWLKSTITELDPKYLFNDPPPNLKPQFQGAPEFHIFYPFAKP